MPTFSYNRRIVLECVNCRTTFELHETNHESILASILSEQELRDRVEEHKRQQASTSHNDLSVPEAVRRAFLELSLAVNATKDDVKRRYSEESFAWHPDRFKPGTPMHERASARLKAINAARSVLYEHFQRIDLLTKHRSQTERENAERMQQEKDARRREQQRRDAEAEEARKKEEAEAQRRAQERVEAESRRAEELRQQQQEKEKHQSPSDAPNKRQIAGFRPAPNTASTLTERPKWNSLIEITAAIAGIIAIAITILVLPKISTLKNRRSEESAQNTIPFTSASHVSSGTSNTPFEKRHISDSHLLQTFSKPSTQLGTNQSAKQFTDSGLNHYRSGHFANAVTDLQSAILIDANTPEAINALVWIYSTCPDARIRSGENAWKLIKSTRMIERAKANNDPWEFCGIIAAAYAEIGDFAAAVEWQKKSMQKSPEEWAPFQKERLHKYLHLIPFRDQNPPAVVKKRQQ